MQDHHHIYLHILRAVLVVVIVGRLLHRQPGGQRGDEGVAIAEAAVMLEGRVLREHRPLGVEQLHEPMVVAEGSGLGGIVLELNVEARRLEASDEGLDTDREGEEGVRKRERGERKWIDGSSPGWVVVPPASVHVSTVVEGESGGVAVSAGEELIVHVGRRVRASHGCSKRNLSSYVKKSLELYVKENRSCLGRRFFVLRFYCPVGGYLTLFAKGSPPLFERCVSGEHVVVSVRKGGFRGVFLAFLCQDLQEGDAGGTYY